MIKKIRTLSKKRRMLREQIRARHGELNQSRQLLVEKTYQYLGTRRAVTQAFVAGYLVDQLRSLMPDKLMQLRVYLPWMMRYMQ
ncbi:hypothetical protein SAMN05660653_02595 [Desulfonatronum thiosulfatophilum]|uniref:Uncharacterized protein n=1 Tax=Desulfonatronum thiosulfatophilum TaxID=617002 RepID=A0A1G6E403_9BACT|nr:hypothetical protein [Desulfonatronum thiosulfatophilum]SDB52111.1 hypothetical protein SAMN05660653_02595 [Desulfonatronum thiosulfatophilum]